MKSSKILVVMYGLCRGKGVSKESYKSTIIDPLIKEKHRVDCLHILKRTRIVDDSGLSIVDTASQEPMTFSVDDQVHFCDEGDLSNSKLYNYSKIFRDKHSDDYISNKYLIHQLSKLDMSTRLVDYNKYDVVILVRDDLYFYNEVIDWHFVLYLIKFGPVISKWFWNGGVSERFVVAKPEEAMKIATRINLAKESIDKYGCLNGEYLQKYMFDFYKMTPLAISLRFCRVRVHKKLHKEKYIYPLWRPLECLLVVKSQINVLKHRINYILCKRRADI